MCVTLKGVFYMRVNMTLNDELLERIDNYAKSNYMTRSSVVSFACNQFLMANELQSLMVDMKRALQTIANNETITDEQLKELEKFENLCDLLTKKSARKQLKRRSRFTYLDTIETTQPEKKCFKRRS